MSPSLSFRSFRVVEPCPLIRGAVWLIAGRFWPAVLAACFSLSIIGHWAEVRPEGSSALFLRIGFLLLRRGGGYQTAIDRHEFPEEIVRFVGWKR